ncbi:hypothetical protein AB0A95_26930 [Micromonospora sp. NPDC049230]|uniref:hypothetical protein n=1 Tax=Micromonospora sp. NPDC049230 TaxID=3155502 RepID=UPI0033D9BD76
MDATQPRRVVARTPFAPVAADEIEPDQALRRHVAQATAARRGLTDHRHPGGDNGRGAVVRCD